MKKIILAVAMILATGQALAGWCEPNDPNIIYVRPDGDNAYNGQCRDTAKADINSAVAAVGNQGIVRVYPGTYRENLATSKQIKLEAQWLGSVKVNGTTDVNAVFLFSSPVVIENFIIRAPLDGNSVAPVFSSPGNCGIWLNDGAEGSVIRNCDIQGLWDGIYFANNAPNVVIDDCNILSQCDGIQLSASFNTKILNSFVATTGDCNWGSAVTGSGNSDVLIDKCVINAGTPHKLNPDLLSTYMKGIQLLSYGATIKDTIIIVSTGYDHEMIGVELLTSEAGKTVYYLDGVSIRHSAATGTDSWGVYINDDSVGESTISIINSSIFSATNDGNDIRTSSSATLWAGNTIYATSEGTGSVLNYPTKAQADADATAIKAEVAAADTNNLNRFIARDANNARDYLFMQDANNNTEEFITESFDADDSDIVTANLVQIDGNTLPDANLYLKQLVIANNTAQPTVKITNTSGSSAGRAVDIETTFGDPVFYIGGVNTDGVRIESTHTALNLVGSVEDIHAKEIDNSYEFVQDANSVLDALVDIANTYLADMDSNGVPCHSLR